MEEKERFIEKAQEGYMVCFAEQCPQHEQCLRWKVGQVMPDTVGRYTCVNPHHKEAGTAQCQEYRPAEKLRMAKGMTHIFNDDMPRRVEPAVRKELNKLFCRTYFYEYRSGKRLIPPALQEEICEIFRNAGWDGEVCFDGFVDDYEW